LRIEIIARVSSRTSVLNWSVSQPRSSSPALASIEPSMPCGGGDLDLVLEGVAGEGGVVGLDVELEVLFEAVGAEEGDAAGDVEVVLVLGRLLRLGLDEELALEADALGVIHGHVQEAARWSCSRLRLVLRSVS
jgi:hypothetical protein